MDEILNSIISKKKEREEIKTNDEYIKWLENFSAENSFFTTSCDVSTLKCSKEDEKNIEKLDSLFIVVDDYADENFIPSNSDNNGYNYVLKYKNSVFCVGIECGQGVSFYAFRLDDKCEFENMIDFNDIQNDVKTQKAKLMREELEKLKQFVLSLEEKGISSETIKSSVNSTLELKK